jgi:beta-glucosidase
MPETALPYLDPDQPLPARVADLLSRLTLEEKIGLMHNQSSAVPRLGIPAYNYWNEALHGVLANGMTVFPQAIGLAATWDTELMRRVASAIADEARANHHAALKRQGFTDFGQGLTYWSPNINLFRDPRWGRGQETYGEDPVLTGEMGAAFVRGLQGDDPRYLKTAACAKHFAVHSGPEGDRHHFDAQVSARDLRDSYLPAFKKLVTEAKVEAVMGAYNRVNGQPACVHAQLLVEILRGEWQFDGHVVSDCWALQDVHQHHKVTADAVETAALALRRGCDLACGCNTYENIAEAIGRGLIAESDLDRSLGHTLATRLRLGMFDPPERVPYAAIPESVIDCPEHRALARRAAAQSIVLLKNRDGILPLRPEAARRILVTGPFAADLHVLLGNYFGTNGRLVTFLEGLVGGAPQGTRLSYRMGFVPDRPNLNPLDWSIGEAVASDVVIACVGTSTLFESEEGDAILSADKGDRPALELSAPQADYIRKLAVNGAKVVLVVTGGSPVLLTEVEEYVQAILYVWYPGEEGGSALADVLFGRGAPGGRLPITFPKHTADLPPFEDYAMSGRTYRYSTLEPLYPFGFGLGYTTFAYTDLRLEKPALAAGDPLSLRLCLANTGPVRGSEIVQVYLTDREASAPVPFHKLVAFRRVELEPGESRALEFTLRTEDMSFFDEGGQLRLEPGEFRVTVGGCSPGKRGQALGAPQPVQAVFTLR